MGALASRRQALAVPEPAIGAEVLETFDVDRDLRSQVALDDIVAVDHFTALQDLGISKLVDPLAFRYVDFLADFTGIYRTDAVDVSQSDDDALVCWYVDTCNSSHATILLLGRANRSGRFNP